MSPHITLMSLNLQVEGLVVEVTEHKLLDGKIIVSLRPVGEIVPYVTLVMKRSDFDRLADSFSRAQEALGRDQEEEECVA